MIWSDHIGWYAQPVVYVLFADSTYQRFDDTFDPYTDPGATGETPPPGLIDPTLGFGKVWREQAGVRAALGWATAPEAPGLGKFQLFFHGQMIWVEAAGRTYVFHQGTVHVFDIPFGGE